MSICKVKGWRPKPDMTKVVLETPWQEIVDLHRFCLKKLVVSRVWQIPVFWGAQVMDSEVMVDEGLGYIYRLNKTYDPD